MNSALKNLQSGKRESMHIKTYKVVSAKYHNRDENKIPWVFKGGKQFHPDRGISEMVRIYRISHFRDYERDRESGKG